MPGAGGVEAAGAQPAGPRRPADDCALPRGVPGRPDRRAGGGRGVPGEQLDIEDASALEAYGARENTRLDHVRELRRLPEYREFAEVEPEPRTWVDARAWSTGEGPKALFDAAVGWLRERRMLLPG
ncbi:DUF4158 domain-containing protein [Streptomyces sp. BE147]|nr:DUF4158 domain-containing protein [Streptomyces sp. BE147]